LREECSVTIVTQTAAVSSTLTKLQEHKVTVNHKDENIFAKIENAIVDGISIFEGTNKIDLPSLAPKEIKGRTSKERLSSGQKGMRNKRLEESLSQKRK
jgi:hypothetical protein